MLACDAAGSCPPFSRVVCEARSRGRTAAASARLCALVTTFLAASHTDMLVVNSPVPGAWTSSCGAPKNEQMTQDGPESAAPANAPIMYGSHAAQRRGRR